MPVLSDWYLVLTADHVLRAQGAVPEIIRQRRPSFVISADKAINHGKYLLKPLVLFEKYQVKEFRHERLELQSRGSNKRNFLTGSLIAQHLSSAREVFVLLCTIGPELDVTVSSLFNQDPLSALALDAFGSAAVELLAIHTSNYFEKLAQDAGSKTSMPLNPGMIGWPVEVGQPEIFSLVDSDEINVSLSDSYMMIPNKSVSLVIGMGEDLSSSGSSCEYCSLNGICRYQNHYE